MCTAIAYYDNGLYFGRTLDHQFSYGEGELTIPKGFDFGFRKTEDRPSLYEIKGVGIMQNGYPLLFDGMNSEGLCMAGLNFSGNCVYADQNRYSEGIASFEFIPWVLSQNKNVREAVEKIKNTVILDTPFAENTPPAPLHWILADSHDCAVAEQTAEGLKVFDNAFGVLANDPTFDWQTENLRRYVNLTPYEKEKGFSETAPLSPIGLGSGAVGLPGDWSSPSRFVRASFVRNNYIPTEKGAVEDFFSILATVEQPSGICRLANGTLERTLYKVCYDTSNNDMIFRRR